MRYYSLIPLWIFSVSFSQSGYEIAKKMSERDIPKDIKSKLIMTLEDKKGRTRESVIQSFTKDSGDKQIMWFLDPPDNRGISLYKIESDEGNDIMKMYLPAFKKVRKISSKRRSEVSWVQISHLKIYTVEILMITPMILVYQIILMSI